MGDGQREALHHLRRAQDPVRSASYIAAGSETSNPRRVMDYLPSALLRSRIGPPMSAAAFVVLALLFAIGATTIAMLGPTCDHNTADSRRS
jgi:hypothetical protein